MHNYFLAFGLLVCCDILFIINILVYVDIGCMTIHDVTIQHPKWIINAVCYMYLVHMVYLCSDIALGMCCCRSCGHWTVVLWRHSSIPQRRFCSKETYCWTHFYEVRRSEQSVLYVQHGLCIWTSPQRAQNGHSSKASGWSHIVSLADSNDLFQVENGLPQTTRATTTSSEFRCILSHRIAYSRQAVTCL